MRSRTRYLLFPLLSQALMACGGIDVAPGGSGGASSSHVGSGTGSGSGSGKGNGATGSPSTGTGLSLCDQFCAATGSCFEDCHTTCQALQAAPCEAEGTALVSCMSSSYDAVGCTPTGDCATQAYTAFSACHAAAPSDCAPLTCTASASSCACTAQCAAGERKTLCTLHKNGEAECSCYLGGILFLTCGTLPTTTPNSPAQCALTDESCCGKLL